MRLLALATALPFLLSLGLPAQEPVLPADSTPCTYDRCALRVEDNRLLRGTVGRPVLTLGMWGAPSLRAHITEPDSAAHYASEFDRHYTAGQRLSTLGLLGTLVMGVIVTHAERSNSELSDREFVAQVSGSVVTLALLIYGSRRLDRAFRALARGVWWYNRELPR